MTLEDAFWQGQKDIAQTRQMTVSDLIGAICAAPTQQPPRRRFGCSFWSSIAARFLTLRTAGVLRDSWLHHHTPHGVINNPRAISHLNPGVWPALQGDFVKLCGEQVIFRSAEMFQ